MAALLAVALALVLQLVMTAEHLGAEAGRLADPSATTRTGFLQICTGEGIVTMPVPAAGTGAPGSASHSGCVICANACVANFDLPSVPAQPVFVAFVATPVERPVPVVTPRWQRLRTAHAIRAPPRLSA